MMLFCASFKESVTWTLLQDVESVASRQAQSSEDAEDASLQACIQFYREHLQDVVSLSVQRAAMRRQLADITATKLQEQCPDGQLLYATYVDDFMLAQIYKQHARPDIAMDGSFVLGLSLGCAWLAVLFCSDI